MHEVLLLPSAEADLDAIAIYTRERWGRSQAQRYIAALRADIEGLTRYPLANPRHASRHGEFRKLYSGHHVVFYQAGGLEVVVVRLLHERMNFEVQLDGRSK